MDNQDISTKSFSMLDKIPPDILSHIFKNYLKYVDVINCSLAMIDTIHCDLVVDLYLGPKLCDYSKLDVNLMKSLLDEGWKQDCRNNDLIVKLWRKYEPCKSK